MVGPKKQDFWPRINILEEKKKTVDKLNSSKILHRFPMIIFQIPSLFETKN